MKKKNKVKSLWMSHLCIRFHIWLRSDEVLEESIVVSHEDINGGESIEVLVFLTQHPTLYSK
jgi:hypothetical protein